MSNYVKATNFAVKDGLITTDPAKIIKGTEIDNEYNAIASAISSKADSNSPSLTGVPTAPTATAGTNTTQIATTAFVQAAAGLATNIGGGGANKVVYQSSTNNTAFIDAPTTTGQYLGWNGSSFVWSAVTASSPNSLTINNSGSGASSGATFNGSFPVTISYNTVGAPSTSGTGATGTWGINITGSSGSTTYATSAGACTGNAATVTNGVYTTGDQTIAGVKTFSGGVLFTNSGTSAFSVGGTSTTTSMLLNPSSINFYDADTGNGYNSIYYSASSTALADQNYTFAFKTPSVSSATTVFQFYGDGTANKVGGGSWGSISDSRLKENVSPLTGSLEKITSLNPVSYTWKIPTSNEPTVGFIAQEVQAVIPNAVTSHKPTTEESQFISDKTLTIGWQNDMTAYLVGAIKELKAELDTAKARITALENA